MLNNLKRQIYDYKTALIKKDEELFIMKRNSKVSKFHELEIKYDRGTKDFEMLTEQYNLLRANFGE